MWSSVSGFVRCRLCVWVLFLDAVAGVSLSPCFRQNLDRCKCLLGFHVIALLGRMLVFG